MNVLALCPGSGSLELAIQRSTLASLQPRTVAYVEREAFAGAHLAGAMAKARLDEAPIWSDVRTFDARPWRAVVDCVTGGYPCQPFSSAGKQLGEEDPNHLWPEIFRIVSESDPALCIFENVPPHLSQGADRVVKDLQSLGYTVAGTLWTAEEVGAPHKRERLFIVASHPDRYRELQQQGDVTDIVGRPSNRSRRWPVEPKVGRVAHGLASRLDQMRLLGNGVVPSQAAGAIDECLTALQEHQGH